MTHVFERVFLKCPYVRARQYLREALQKAVDEETPHRLALGIPLIAAPASLEKNVIVRYEHAKDPLHFDDPWQVYWTPEHGGPYPDFSGEITVRADESYHDALLELTGDYAPPLGAVGKAFDMVLGAKIASATARALLHEIGEAMEARYRREEAERHRQSA